MKYCPYCGVSLLDDTASFCGECGKSLPKSGIVNRNVKLKKTVSKAHPFIEWLSAMIHPPKISSPPVTDDSQPVEDGYDGYYNDVLPTDYDEAHDSIDKELIKKIAILIGAVAVVLVVCILIMCLL